MGYRWLIWAVVLGAVAISAPARADDEEDPPAPDVEVDQLGDREAPPAHRSLLEKEREAARQRRQRRQIERKKAHQRALWLEYGGIVTASAGGGLGLVLGIVGLSVDCSSTGDRERGSCQPLVVGGFTLMVLAGVIGGAAALLGHQWAKDNEPYLITSNAAVPAVSVAIARGRPRIGLRWRF